MTLSVWRLEPGGAEGQLESMATGTTMMLPPLVEEAQVLSHVILHNGNCNAGAGITAGVAESGGLPHERDARAYKRSPLLLQDG
jgi:hypothetical protein